MNYRGGCASGELNRL